MTVESNKLDKEIEDKRVELAKTAVMNNIIANQRMADTYQAKVDEVKEAFLNRNWVELTRLGLGSL